MSITKLKQMNYLELNELSQELRKEILSTVKNNGGHLASNLGAVELTIALHYVFDTPNDKLIFDVGHQCYAHKILTGRGNNFKSLRQKGGIAGFPKSEESEFDTFNTGHASTSISLMSGLMLSKNLLKQQYKLVAVVGDGAFSGGECFEALNNLKNIDGDCLIVLNDNSITISKSVGAITSTEENLKAFLKSLNINYLGTVDGHNLPCLIESLNDAKNKKGHNLIRVVTQKGKGDTIIENDPKNYHSYSVSNIKTFAQTVGNKLIEIKEKNDKTFGIAAAMTDAVGLNKFMERFKDSFFDVGICEAHAVSMAAGLSKGGLKPYVAIYSSFLQRAFDQILSDIAIPNLPVTFLIDRSGLVDGDGDTHQGIYDIDLINFPNMTVFSPATSAELERAIDLSQTIDAPVAIRYTKYNFDENFEVLDNNCDLEILCTSNVMTKLGKSICELLKIKGINASVKNVFELTKKIQSQKPILVLEDSFSGSFFKNIDLVKKLGFHINKPIGQGSIDELIDDCFDRNEILQKTLSFIGR